MVPGPMAMAPSLLTSPARAGSVQRPLRIGFVGAPGWLSSCCPPPRGATYRTCRLPLLEGTDHASILVRAAQFLPDVTVVFDPGCLPREILSQLPGATLGIVVGDVDGRLAARAEAFDRLVSFRSALTGLAAGSVRIWRAIPPPIADALFAEIRPLHDRPQVMTIGRSTEHRENLLLAAKHHHDVLQVISGVVGDALAELLHEYDVGIYVPPWPWASGGPQVGMHLAAGQVLMSSRLDPAHGLEYDIDYVGFTAADELVWTLDRLGRFPEMYQRVRIRGRLKAECQRASQLFARVITDMLGDIDAFGSDRVS